MISIVDFCSQWERLSELTRKFRGHTPTKNMYWHKWREYSDSSIYTLKFHGLKIPQQRDFEEVQQPKAMNDLIKLNSASNDEERIYPKWPICFNLINPNANLQWGSCSITFCFNCLIKWMLENSTWPNWRINLTKPFVHPNKEWKTLINILKKKLEKPKYPLCEEHKEKSKLFWVNWNWFVCLQWVVNQKHSGHSLITNEEKSKELNKNIEQKLVNDNSGLNINFDYTNSLKNYWDLKSIILKNASEPLIQSINEIWEEINSRNKQLWIEYTKKAKEKQDIWRESENILLKYKNTQDPGLILEASQVVKKIDTLRSNVISNIRENLQQIQNCDSLSIGYEWFLRSVVFSTSTISKDDWYHEKFEFDSNVYMELYICYLNDDLFNILLNFTENERIKCYLKLELETNNIWELEYDENQIIEIVKKSQRVGEIKFKSEIDESDRNTKLYLKITAWKIDEKKHETYKRNIQSLILDIIQKKFKNDNVKQTKDTKSDKNSESHMISNKEWKEQTNKTKK